MIEGIFLNAVPLLISVQRITFCPNGWNEKGDNRYYNVRNGHIFVIPLRTLKMRLFTKELTMNIRLASLASKFYITNLNYILDYH